MKKFYNWIIDYWWIVLICLLALYIVTISIINVPEITRVTTTAFNYFNQIIAPLGVILGLILGYPLLKRKLVDSYVTKQFDIIHDNNRIVKRECLRLKEKYPIKYISQTLNQEFLLEILSDIKKLNELAIDANSDAYKYSYLLFKSLETFTEKTKSKIPQNYYEGYYCETLSTFIHNHIDEIFQYSRSIGYIPKSGKIKEKPILVSKINKYVTGNNYYQIENIDNSLSNKHTSALLVSFFSTNNNCLGERNGLLYQSCYQAAPSPSPFARIMYNQGIYMPLALVEEDIIIGDLKLVLVGFKRMKSVKFDSGISTHYLVCHYANISMVGWVKGQIKDKQSLIELKDSYIKIPILDAEDIEDFNVNGESLILKISEKNAIKYFHKVKNELCRTMDNEM